MHETSRAGDRAGPIVRRWDQLPSPVRVPLSVVGAIAGYAGVRVAATTWDEGSSGWWLFLAGVLVLAGIVIGVSLVLARRRLGGPDQPRLLRQALASGEVPDGADRVAWEHELGRRRRQLAETAWTVWLMGVSFGLLGLLVLVVAIAVLASGGPPVAVVLLLVVLAVLGLAFWGVLRLRRWQVARHERVLSALRGADHRVDPAGSPE